MKIETESVGSAVETMRFVHGERPVFYACLPMGSCVGSGVKGSITNGEDEKRRLVSGLCDHLAANGNPLWERYSSHDRSAFPIRVVHGLLGKPHLLLGQYPGPAVSFSQSSDNVWAALCGDGCDIGIDVAESREFRGEYPFNRVFHPQELAHALKLAGDVEKASALLWSIKEAFVKALGCGFHLVDPKQIMVYPADGPPLREKNAHAFSVNLSEKAARRFPVFKDRFLQIKSLCRGKMWLSIALLQGQDPGGIV